MFQQLTRSVRFRKNLARSVCFPMSNIKLYYFDIEARAEAIRLALVLGDVPFEDIRLSREEFGKKKAEGFFKFGQMPVLEVDGKQYAQSVALGLWAANKAGIEPSDPLQQLRITEARLLVDELVDKMIPSFRLTDLQERLAARKLYCEKDLPQYFGYAEKLLTENGTGYFVGKVTTRDKGMGIIERDSWEE